MKKALERARGEDLLARLERRARDPARQVLRRRHGPQRRPVAEAALGRAMMRETPLLLVLDEPTSALDAQAEHNLFEEYAASAKRVAQEDRRDHGARLAPLLHRPDGRPHPRRQRRAIQESGSHDELMALDGLYADLYGMQAKAYS